MFGCDEITPDPTEAHPVTRDELLALARHWIEFLQDEQFSQVCSPQYGWSDEVAKIRAYGRLNWLREVLGADVIRREQERCDDRMREQIGQERWRIWKEGTKAERDQFEEDCHLQTNEFRLKFYDDARADRAFARLHNDPALTFTDGDGDVWFFGARHCTAVGKLNLALRTADGCVGYDGSRSIDRPNGSTPRTVSVATA
jgi:hypothetical protein